MKTLWCDLETTGRDPVACGIHEVACIFVDSVQRVIVERRWFVRPFEGCTYETGWDTIAEEISEQRVQSYNTTEAQFHLELTNWLGQFINKYDKEDKAFFAGYNSDFDNSFMRKLFDRCGDAYFGSWFFNPSFDVMPICTLALADRRHLMPNFKLSTVYKELTGSELEHAHEGLEDIRATRRIYKMSIMRLKDSWLKPGFIEKLQDE